MDTLSSLADGFAVALTWQNLLLALLGCFLGTIMGALPGLGPSNGVAILIPLAFTLGLGATPSLILLTSVYYGANVRRPDLLDPPEHSRRRTRDDDLPRRLSDGAERAGPAKPCPCRASLPSSVRFWRPGV